MFSSTGVGSLASTRTIGSGLSSSLKTGLAAGAAGYITYKAGKAVLGTAGYMMYGGMPYYYGHYWGRSHYYGVRILKQSLTASA